MRRTAMRRMLVVCLSVVLILPTGAVVSAAEVPLPGPDAGWLEWMNYYRASSDVGPVTEDASLVRGLELHLEYLAKTPSEQQTGAYANAHFENPVSPWYTSEGANAGRSSNLIFPLDDMDADQLISGWIGAPFHSLGLLQPGLRRSAFVFRNSVPYNFAGVDVASGLESVTRHQILFPGRNSLTAQREFLGESPDPREGCPGNFHVYTGLPIFASFVTPPDAETSAQLQLPDGSVLTHGPDLCVQTRQTFRSTDPVYGRSGQAAFDNANLVILIPKANLKRGRHSVKITQASQGMTTWDFTVVGARPQSAGMNSGMTLHACASRNSNVPSPVFADPDGGIMTMSFVSGLGSDDNHLFRIVGDKIHANVDLDGTRSSYSIRVQVVNPDQKKLVRRFPFTLGEITSNTTCPPSALQVKLGAGFADISWRPPANGLAPTGYGVHTTPGNNYCWTTSTHCRLTGLKVGTSYTARVYSERGGRGAYVSASASALSDDFTVSAVTTVTSPIAAAIKIGSKCPSVGKRTKVGATKIVCKKVGKKLLWQRG